MGGEFRWLMDGKLHEIQLADARLPGLLTWALHPKTSDLVSVGWHSARGGSEKVLSTYDLKTGESKRRWKDGPKSTIFSRDGSQIVDVDGATFRLYGCERREETQTIELPKVEGQRNSLRCPAWSSNGRLLATVVPHNMAFDSRLEDYDRLALWDVRLRKLLGALTIPSRVRPNQLVFAPSNDKIISVHSDKLLMLWDAKKMVPSVARRPSVRISHLIGRTGLTGGKYAT